MTDEYETHCYQNQNQHTLLVPKDLDIHRTHTYEKKIYCIFKSLPYKHKVNHYSHNSILLSVI